MHGMSYENGIPHVWGEPCTLDPKPVLLDCFSQYQCPHCGAHLSGKPPEICLNACHLTAPQAREFKELMYGLREDMFGDR